MELIIGKRLKNYVMYCHKASPRIRVFDNVKSMTKWIDNFLREHQGSSDKYIDLVVKNYKVEWNPGSTILSDGDDDWSFNLS